MEATNIVFIDCESAGLRGEIFSCAMIAHDGTVIFNGFYRHPALNTNDWLRENVEPNLTGTEFPDEHDFLKAFSTAWYAAKETYGWEPWGAGKGKALAAVAHMGAPVESNLFQELFNNGALGEFDGAYPLLDTSPLLFRAGFDPTSEQGFAEKTGLKMPNNYKVHSALSDAELTRRVWNELTK